KKLRPAVQEAKSKNAFFISRQGKRICGRRVEQIVDMWLKAAGLNDKGYSAHKLRHTAATLMYQHGGVDIRLLQDMLGHANLGTTEIYTHISSTQLENAAKKNPLSGVKQRNIRKIDSDDEKKDT
ncbi:MAG: tyrosine-type recombinase/integrase, partial [Hydrogenoanaerobacterium sp.]